MVPRALRSHTKPPLPDTRRRSPRVTGPDIRGTRPHARRRPLAGVCVRASGRAGRRCSVGGAHATAFRSWPGSGTKPRNMGMRGGLILSGENKYPSSCASARPQLSWNPDGGSRINSRLEPGTRQNFADRTLGKDPSKRTRRRPEKRFAQTPRRDSRMLRFFPNLAPSIFSLGYRAFTLSRYSPRPICPRHRPDIAVRDGGSSRVY